MHFFLRQNVLMNEFGLKLMILGMSSLIVTINYQCFSAQSSVEMYAEYEGNKQNGSCIGELIIAHCSVKGSSSLTWTISRTSLTLTGNQFVTLLAAEGREGTYRVIRTSTNDLHIYQNKTIVGLNSQIDSEMHIQLDNENDFVEVKCEDSTAQINLTVVSVLGMFKIVIPIFLLLLFIQCSLFL